MIELAQRHPAVFALHAPRGGIGESEVPSIRLSPFASRRNAINGTAVEITS